MTCACPRPPLPDRPSTANPRHLPRGRGAAFALALAAVVSLEGTSLLSAAEAEFASTPLAVPAGVVGTTRFTRLGGDVTGIQAPNPYDDPRMWTDLFERFAYGSMGTGVAIGDYDNDGRPDVFVACKTAGNHLFRNLGDWRFEEVTAAAGVAGPTGAWKSGAAFADVNNDGRLDLYVCRVGAPNLLYLNQGNGTFAESAHAAGIDVSDASVMGAFADYDRDGALDLYLVTNLLDYGARPEGQRDRLFRNRGDGTFTEVTAAAGIFGEGQKHTAVWWDYDADGWPDLYVTYDYGWPDQLFHNNGNGTFTNTLGQVMPHVPRFSMGADAGDVNNDGLIDLFVPDMLPTTRERDQTAMIDARAHIPDLPDPAMTPQYMHNSLFVNTGTGRFQDVAFLAGVAATDWTWSPRLEDLDNDGRLDLHITNGSIRKFFDGDLRRQFEALPPAERKRLFKNSPVLGERNLAFRNRGDLGFENVSATWGLDELGVSFGAAFGDLDGDGDLDLVTSNFDADVSVYRNDSTTGQRLVVALRGRTSNRFGVGATVRIETAAGPQVRQLTIARGYQSSSEPILHFGLGEADSVRRLVVRWPSGAEQTFNDIAADHRLTITEPATGGSREPAATEHTAQFVEVGHAVGLDVKQPEPPLDELAAQPLLPFRQNQSGPGVAVGDVDGDGADDVVIGASSAARTALLRAQADGRFVAAGLPDAPSPLADAGPLLFDANGDGAPDLLLAHGGVVAPAGDPDYQPRLLLNDGHGRFTPAPAEALPSLHASVGPVVTADFDRDGALDVFLGGRVTPGDYAAPPRSALWRRQGGRFVDVTEELAPGLARCGQVAAAVWSDVDDDGWPDLLLALQWGAVRYWHNEQGRRFTDQTEAAGFLAAGTGWWNSITAGDFNGDGQMDYAVGNTGLNTPYKATANAPAVLLSGAVDRTGRTQLLEAELHEGRIVPRRGRSTMARVMPWVAQKMPTFAAYARASLDDIFGADVIARARRLEVTELRSGVFLSQPGHTFRFEPLPRLAQIAPVFGLVAADWNGDGHLDLALVQNSYAPVPEVGRFDNGLGQLLLGDGAGHFTAVRPGESHFIVTGDAKGLALLDLDGDGWPELLATRNNEPALVFGNTGADGARGLRVLLRGPRGNPTAIGARVSLRLANGPVLTAEAAAGSGYLSQSAAGVFFAYPERNPPQALRVRWPSGAVSTHPLRESAAGTIAISAPAN